MSKNTRLLSPASHSSQYVDSSASQSSSSRNANGSYVPPGRIQTLTVSGAAEEEYDNEASRALPEDDDGFKVFPGLFSWPRWWQWVVVILLGVFAALAFTVLKQPLENIGVTSEHLLKYGSIPLISVVFTYCHIWMALWMTFYPIDYFGCCQIPGTNTGLGWQGIVPFKGEKMARMAVNLMTQRLFDVREIFGRLLPQQVAAEMGPILHTTLDDVINGVAALNAPDLWSVLPVQVKREIINKAHEDAPPAIAELMKKMQENITDVFDIEDMVIRTLTRDKALLTNIFIACGHAELQFIRNCGAYLGLSFGVIQMAIWIVYENRWLLPGFGFVVGILTNWLALKMIFEPIQAYHPCGRRGPKIQGLFLQRQKEVSAVYAKTISKSVLTSKNILASLIAGPATERLFALVHQHVKTACDEFAGSSRSLITITVGSEMYARIKDDICSRILDALPALFTSLEQYTDRALDMEPLLREKMAELPSEEFEGMLHPVFQEDEWKLVLMGGVLGVVIGFAQIQMLGA